ncbi:hypothetical protein PDESU_05084 [Pontiella desulfatans]|uniref:Uncharacterized protein n=1 Tax=Pontiella desulfatans TaxID=2750659 RepID=A0A6C2U9G0_PONDE|nr:hypothetical protein [Pontiella desulfatans]VGO16493.1 hypothetical protein PDESU_05084 [Pontiella desulfatans]
MAPRYAKEMPGAEQVLRPGNLADYEGEAWDIRISVGDAPLDEAFFFPVESLADSDRSVRELLEQFALNPDREAELDIDHYPDLPFLQQELVQFYEAARKGQFNLKVFVNHGEGELDLESSAREVLASCTFRNRAWDYLVLDLVFEAETASADSTAVEAFVGRHQNNGSREALQGEAEALAATYEKFASVSVAPCALGVPDGFDVRLQMMEFDGLDPERCVLAMLMAEGGVELAEAFGPVCQALAFKTNFTTEILEGLKSLEDASIS